MTIYCHKGDLPDDFKHNGSIAVDSETLGLKVARDRLCVVQVSSGDGNAHLVQLKPEDYENAPNLKAVLGDTNVLKIFHYARFDIAAIQHYLGVGCTPVYCTKIASKLARTYTDRHGLKSVCEELTGVQLDKGQQSSDWAAEELSDAQKKYAANDVLYLHEMMARLNEMLKREGRMELAQACFSFLPVRAMLDLQGWEHMDIFSHE